MKNLNIFHILLTVLILISGPVSVCLADISYTDTAGVTVTLPGPAERVVCLNSDAAEAMVVLGNGDKVVGLTESVMTDTALMAHLPKAISVGDWQTPSIEKVLALKPDAVITYSSSKPKNADQFTNAGINLIYLDVYKFNTLKHDMQSIGIMTGAEKKAGEYIAFLDRWIDAVNARIGDVSGETAPHVYIEGYSDYSAQGKGSGVDVLMETVKGKNLAADLGEQWPKVTPEWVISENPTVILKTASLKPDNTLNQIRESILSRTGFETLDAVKNNQVYVLNGDLVYGPRSPAGLVYLAKALHADKCADISPDKVLEEYSASFVSGTEKGDYFAPGL